MDNDQYDDDEQDAARQDSAPAQQHAGASGEGAASALARLKTQDQQVRRLAGDADASGEGPST